MKSELRRCDCLVSEAGSLRDRDGESNSPGISQWIPRQERSEITEPVAA